MDKIILEGKDYKALAAAVTRFPGAGFAEVGGITLLGADGVLIAASMGTALTRAVVPANGSLKLVAIDEATLSRFAGICSDTAKLVISCDGKTLSIRTKHQEAVNACSPGQHHKFPNLNGDVIALDAKAAKSIAFLAGVAFEDSSRPELCCVMLTGKGWAMACSQQVIAAMKCHSAKMERAAVPVSLAKVLGTGDTIHPGEKETVLDTTIAQYYVPAPVKAQAEFPVDLVTKLGAAKKTKVAVCLGKMLAQAIAECGKCLSGMAKTDVAIKMEGKGAALELSGENGGMRFRRTVASKDMTAGCVLYAPLAELANVAPILDALEGDVTISQGSKGETYLDFEDGWVVFPSWKSGK